MTAIEDRVHAWLLDQPDQGEPAPTGAEIASLVRATDPLLSASEVHGVVARVAARMGGLGPLDPILADPEVTDLMVNGPGPVWVERAGRLARTTVVLDRAQIEGIVERIVAPLGRRVDPVSPVVDARLPDGSRVHAVVPPLAVDGPCLTIRRFAVRPFPLEAIASAPVAELLRWAMRARANVVVSGGTGSGKTTLINALGRHVPAHERIITVEDAAEIRLPSEHVVRLETRPASADGTGAVDGRELVRNALRMRPDRLIVGEVRGPEALDMVQAMNTGHDGSLSTIHANSAEDAMRRLETLVLLAGVGLPMDAVRDHLAAAIDLVVHLARDAQGVRRVVEVAEVSAPGGTDGPHPTRGARRTRRVADGHRVLDGPTRGLRHAAAGPFDRGRQDGRSPADRAADPGADGVR